MPQRPHRQLLRRHPRCFSAGEAQRWLRAELRDRLGAELSAEQARRLLGKFLQSHIIEDIHGRWGHDSLGCDSALYRFPSTSPVKPPLSPSRENSENFPTDIGKLFKLPNLSKRTLKKRESLQSLENLEKNKPDVIKENKEETLPRKEISQEYVHETWRNIVLIHLQSILGLPSLEGVLQPTQLVPEHIVYNVSSTSRHGVVVLHDKSEDLPHWVLSAMKCLAYWPRHNDMSQATYSGFERDVFRTVADYFLSLPEPLLTFEYYELFANILVMCGYITIPDLCSGKRSVRDEKGDPQPSKTLHLNSFKSTECLLLSLIHKEPDKKKKDEGSRRFCLKELTVQNQHPKKWQQHKLTRQQGSAGPLMGGSCQNLAGLRKEQDPPGAFRTRCYSLERIGAAPLSVCSKGGCDSLGGNGVNTLRRHRNQSVLELGCADSRETQTQGSSSRVAASALLDGTQGPKHMHCSLSVLGKRNSRSCTAINRPVAEITVKPRAQLWGQGNPNAPGVAASVDIGTEGSEITIQKRLCRSSTELSECSLTPSPCVLTGTQSLLQPHVERIAVAALQICCLLLPPPSRRRLQLLLRMMARISGNVDMPRLHPALGTRALLIQTFSRCVLRCAEEEVLDELLSARLVSFLMDHHQEILQVPTHLQVAVQDHLQHVRMAQCECPKEEICAILPTYSYCKQITPQEFEEQKVSTSQAAVAELLENIIKDENLSVKDKKKKLKQEWKHDGIRVVRIPGQSPPGQGNPGSQLGKTHGSWDCWEAALQAQQDSGADTGAWAAAVSAAVCAQCQGEPSPGCGCPAPEGSPGCVCPAPEGAQPWLWVPGPRRSPALAVCARPQKEPSPGCGCPAPEGAQPWLWVPGPRRSPALAVGARPQKEPSPGCGCSAPEGAQPWLCVLSPRRSPALAVCAQFQREYLQIYRSRFPRTESEALLLPNKPTLRQPLLSLSRARLRSLRD